MVKHTAASCHWSVSAVGVHVPPAHGLGYIVFGWRSRYSAGSESTVDVRAAPQFPPCVSVQNAGMFWYIGM